LCSSRSRLIRQRGPIADTCRRMTDWMHAPQRAARRFRPPRAARAPGRRKRPWLGARARTAAAAACAPSPESPTPTRQPAHQPADSRCINPASRWHAPAGATDPGRGCSCL
jgi:hypothetical protein